MNIAPAPTVTPAQSAVAGCPASTGHGQAAAAELAVVAVLGYN